MSPLMSVLTLAHLIGLSLGLGCATAKLTLLLRSGTDPALVHAFLAVARPITRWIITGLILLTLSGIGWLFLGYGFTPRLVVKLVLVAVLWILGPLIDNVFEPKFRELAPASGEAASPGFVEARQRYVLIETMATGLFWVIVALWILG